MSSVPDRAEIDEEYKWDLESVFATDDEWAAAVEDVREDVEELAAREERIDDDEPFADGERLLDVLELRDDVLRRVSTVFAYARMRRDEDTRDGDAQAMATRARSLYAEAKSAASFVEPALQSCSRDRLEELIATTPGLEEYEHYVDDVLRRAEHTRSAEVESLLADLSEVTGAAGEIYDTFTNADVEFPTVEDPDGDPVEITQSNFTTLQQRSDRDFRRRVHEAFYDTWGEYRNTVATAYEKSVKSDVKLARARDYDTAREAALDEPNVPVEVYDTLVGTVRDRLPTLHRHARLKREALGVDDLRPWDLYAPTAPGEGPTVEYEEAKGHVIDALGALGEDYQRRVAEGLESRWVDVYENEGKRSGAYSSGTYDTQPFILMNYQDDVASMYTLAHELGHSLHSQYTGEEQPYVYSDYEIFVAEVASTVNEALLTGHLLETVEDDHFRRHVLDQYLERFRSTLFRQTMFADFEHRVHERVEDAESLTPDRLDDLYADLKAEFYEPAAMDDRIAREWMRIPHFYRAYYVFQYATGISAAVALAADIRDGDGAAADRYLDFLSKGSREYPLELLRGAGVDMSTGDPIERAIDEYDAHLDELERLL